MRRYERAAPGELVHVDIKKLGNIPDGGGHRAVGRQTGQRHPHRLRATRSMALATVMSRLWRDTLTTAGITHKRTRPYRPQTNGKVERFNRTLIDEWAYAHSCQSESERRDTFPPWLHNYNHHRGQPPQITTPSPAGSGR
ncbi:hypothetical protein GCM10022222_79110 [Amycolatopsis ultiminotia]|uniref:Integrase catalytic domain-containing protein n=1 Tax=Amycolatopsis ultiminotia TaxID=543629 RepID=A0ABP6YIE0_9PSEU